MRRRETFERMEILQMIPAPPLTFALHNLHGSGDLAPFIEPVVAFAHVREHTFDAETCAPIDQPAHYMVPRVVAMTMNGPSLELAESAIGMIFGASWSISEDCQGTDARLPALLAAGDLDGACAVVVECYRQAQERIRLEREAKP